jgi:hypothetical protein
MSCVARAKVKKKSAREFSIGGLTPREPAPSLIGFRQPGAPLAEAAVQDEADSSHPQVRATAAPSEVRGFAR